MRLFVVRHVKAGDRSRWQGVDEERPASKNGRRQAIAQTRDSKTLIGLLLLQRRLRDRGL